MNWKASEDEQNSIKSEIEEQRPSKIRKKRKQLIESDCERGDIFIDDQSGDCHSSSQSSHYVQRKKSEQVKSEQKPDTAYQLTEKQNEYMRSIPLISNMGKVSINSQKNICMSKLEECFSSMVKPPLPPDYQTNKKNYMHYMGEIYNVPQHPLCRSFADKLKIKLNNQTPKTIKKPSVIEQEQLEKKKKGKKGQRKQKRQLMREYKNLVSENIPKSKPEHQIEKKPKQQNQKIEQSCEEDKDFFQIKRRQRGKIRSVGQLKKSPIEEYAQENIDQDWRPSILKLDLQQKTFKSSQNITDKKQKIINILDMRNRIEGFYYLVQTDQGQKWVSRQHLIPEYALLLCEFYERFIVC